jgi:hypothetical protein
MLSIAVQKSVPHWHKLLAFLKPASGAEFAGSNAVVKRRTRFETRERSRAGIFIETRHLKAISHSPK